MELQVCGHRSVAFRLAVKGFDGEILPVDVFSILKHRNLQAMRIVVYFLNGDEGAAACIGRGLESGLGSEDSLALSSHQSQRHSVVQPRCRELP